MPIKKISTHFLLLISLLCIVRVTQAAENEAVTATNSVIGANGDDAIGSMGVVELPSGNIVISSPEWNGQRGAVTCLTPTEYQAGNVVITATNSLTGTTPFDRVGDYGIVILTNGNYVVETPFWDNNTVTDVGAVTWVNGTTCIPHGENSRAAVVSATNSLVGSTSNDLVGDVTALNNGNYVVGSADWDNGTSMDAGAVTWVNGAAGLHDVISIVNSLVGSTASDRIGSPIVALGNGNYLVVSSFWANDTIPEDVKSAAGAVTLVNGTTGLTGTITQDNSLVGTHSNDRVGSSGVTELTNGNYVVASGNWTSSAGAVTWASGATGLTGSVDTSNSLIGAVGHSVGIGGITALTNGHYVISSYNWDTSGSNNVGAVTWANGTIPTTGLISAANSLIGSTTNDQIGFAGNVPAVLALTNGNYVVASPYWNNGSFIDSGAVTWRSGAGATTGVVSTGNSLVGSRDDDYVGIGSVTALTNGHYVVSSPLWNGWDFIVIPSVGAVTWGNGLVGTKGAVTTANSLVGSVADDQVGGNETENEISGITALTNGNYVVSSVLWNNGALVDAGAATWGSGTAGVAGPITNSNSLVGSTTSDQVGGDSNENGITALANGNYVVRSPHWSNGASTDAGAVTWANGTTGLTGVITAGNSLIGNTTSTQIGFGGTKTLLNSQYAVASPNWDNGSPADMGAVTWGGSGATGLTGLVNTANSLVGTQADDLVGSGGITALSNGNYLVISPSWDNGFTTNVGAVTYVNPSGIEPDPEPTLTVELSAATGSGLEGNSGTNPITSITLLVSGGVSTVTRTVNLGLTNGTATLVNNDFSQSSLSITIPAGDYTTTTAINIPVTSLGIVGDTSPEGNETFTLALQNPSALLVIGDANGNSTIVSSALYTITNDEAAGPTVTINDVSLVEGNAGTTTMTFTATFTGAVSGGFSVNTSITPGTATAADSDYEFAPLLLIFTGTNNETRSISVTINGDTKFEPNETFTVSLKTPSKPVDITDTGTGTITNDDVAPTGTLTIADVSLAEGNTGTSTMTFTATLTGASAGFTVNTGIADGTATASSDYTFTPSTLSFAGTNGETYTFTVTINGDTQVEPNETFTVSLNTVSNPAIAISDTAIGIITNDDTATVTIADVSLTEGNAGTSIMTFTATLTGTVAGGFTVNTGVANGTATSGSDYAFTPALLTFTGTNGETRTFTVTINGDTQVEPNETLTVSLNTASSASVVISDTAIGTITNDDAATVTIADMSLTEGNASTSTMTFIATLNGSVAGGFSVNTGIADGTATITSDYLFSPTILNFVGTDGETHIFTVTINGDTLVELNETFTVSLNTPSKPAVVITDTAIGTITNDDVATLTIADASLIEGNTGTSSMTFTATLAGTVAGGFTVNTGIANDTALSGSDYAFTPSTLTFAGTNGETKTFTVTINGDTQVELDNTFVVSLNTVSHAGVSIIDTAVGTITNDDTATVTIADVSLTEGNTGTSTMTFTATLAGTVENGFTVNTGIANGTAASGSDFTFAPGTLTFAGTNGETKTFTVTINGDTLVEGHETFTVSLNTVSNASIIISDTAIGTITNDDVPTGTLTIEDVAITEGNVGPSTMTFTATLAGTVGGFTVNTGILDGTATAANNDYTFTPSTLTFAGTNGETKTFTVTINGDIAIETDETFIVSLNTVSNISIAISDTGIGTITNDDVLPPFFTWAALPAIPNTTLTYELQVATANTFATATIVGSATTTQPSLVGLNPLPLADGVKFWRVRGKYVTATGTVLYSPYSATNSFTIDTIAPPVPALVEPINTALIIATRIPVFKWGLATGAVRYRLEIDTDGNFSTVEKSFSITASPFTLPNASALSNGLYAWRIIAIDAAGNETSSVQRTFNIALP